VVSGSGSAWPWFRFKWPWCGGLWKMVPTREGGAEAGGGL
jgi:hypothetical protein